jgi:hypothetical protein
MPQSAFGGMPAFGSMTTMSAFGTMPSAFGNTSTPSALAPSVAAQLRRWLSAAPTPQHHPHLVNQPLVNQLLVKLGGFSAFENANQQPSPFGAGGIWIWNNASLGNISVWLLPQ